MCVANRRYGRSLMSITHVSEDFKRQFLALVHGLLPVDGTRFYIYVPWVQLVQDTASDGQLDQMVGDYARKFWAVDPMHPSRFEEKQTVVISNSTIMEDAAWRETEIFKDFYQPNGYFHNCDMFLRQKDRIVAVLTLVRKDVAQPFTAREIELLNQVQPFVEYTLGAIYVPSRVHNRSSLTAEYRLTAREVDVVEIATTGVSNKVLCKHLNISLPTLRTHMQNIYAKMAVRSNAELISKLGRVDLAITPASL